MVVLAAETEELAEMVAEELEAALGLDQMMAVTLDQEVAEETEPMQAECMVVTDRNTT